MSFIHNNITALFTALLVCGFAWLYGGAMGDVILPVIPWLCVFLFEVMLCFPQRRFGESTRHARARVWKAMSKDPLVWIALALVVLLCIPFVNNGLCATCDARAIAKGADPEPPIGFLPFCVNRMHHLNVVLWFVPSLVAMVAAKHSLTRYGKRCLLEMIVWNGFALAILGFVQQLSDARGPLWADPGSSYSYFFSTFGYPNMAGDYFAILFCLSVAAWRGRVDDVHENVEKTGTARRLSRHRLFWMKHFMLIPALVNFFAALNTLCRAGILLVSVSAVVLFCHAGVVSLSRMNKADRVRAGALCGLGLIIIAVVASAFMPNGKVHREMSTLDSISTLDRVTGRGEYHAEVAMQIWRDHLLFGCGGWGYGHFCPQKLPPRRYWQAGSSNVHNDYLQFLAEHGLVGFGLMVAIVFLLVIPVARAWKKLSKATRFLPARKQPPPPQALFALPGGAFAALNAAVVPLIHAFGDCPLRSPAVLSLFFVTLACTVGFLPHESTDEDADGNTDKETIHASRK